ncbi:MAG: 8-hydroxy-5-deazaflavin:NADPH oxidoreductase [Actinomycetota bacterium]|jgi:predicted dinucleotide-binding enzyme|nr:8-hydroxy-5-deazaflavin:NADPH oxidoreductase [Actinomycetota bacterium]
MKVAMLGTGVVGQTIGRRLVGLGHEVRMGSRQAGNEKAAAWVAEMGASAGASAGTFADAAGFGDLVVNATAGTVSLDVLAAAGANNLDGKVIIDVSNPLDFSRGVPPTLSVCNNDSVGEQIQARFPSVRVVKTLNTVNADVMVHPEIVPGSHTMFLCGNDAGAKDEVRALLESFGWPPADLLDLGDIGAARGMEMYLPLWLRLWAATTTGHLNIKVVAAH